MVLKNRAVNLLNFGYSKNFFPLKKGRDLSPTKPAFIPNRLFLPAQMDFRCPCQLV
jgi:hypothetical protein